MDQPDQQQLDRWLGLQETDRSAMRSGQLPPRIRRFVEGSGCVQLVIMPIGLAIGMLVAYLGRAAGHSYGLTTVSSMLIGGLVGVILARLVGQRLAESRAARMTTRLSVTTVNNEVLRLRLERAGASSGHPRAVLRAEDGRVFALLMPPPEDLHIDGRYRLFHFDMNALAGRAGDRPDLYVLGLERVD